MYHQLNATVEPENATISALSWSTSNEKVAVVDDTGKVTGIGKGNAKISATATDGCGAKTSVTVKLTNIIWSLQAKNRKNSNIGIPEAPGTIRYGAT